MNLWELRNQTEELITLCKKMREEEPNNEIVQELVTKSLPVLESYLKKIE